MGRLLVLMISIGLVDSINPSTIAPALYLATGKHPRSSVAEFTIAVFVVYLAGGALIALGLGQLVRALIPDVDVRHTVRYVAEIVAGVILIAGALLLWTRRRKLVTRGLPGTNPKRRSSILLGATITAVELPTAFPYFAAIAALLASGLGPARQLLLLVVFNLCFVLPLIGILAIVTFGGSRTNELLARCRSFLERRWPHLLVGLIGLVGGLAIVFGATGLAASIHGHVGGFFRHVRRTLHLHP
jgi:cytochrome c biogenesis protein CcdA